MLTIPPPFRNPFQSTSLSRGKTLEHIQRPFAGVLSIHFPLTREDEIHRKPHVSRRTFNPLPSHEGRLAVRWHISRTRKLSIHFPLTREDLKALTNATERAFQSTSLSRGKTISLNSLARASRSFQSTSLSRGKTLHIQYRFRLAVFQSTSLSRGKTDTEVVGVNFA